MSGFEGLNPVDFGEPTVETQERLGQLFAVLKDLTVGVVYRGEEMYFEGEIVSRVSPMINAGSIVEYSYEQHDDPLFDDKELPNLSFRILEADQKTLTDLFGDLGDYAVFSLEYYDENVEINYRKSLYDEMLHISEPLVAVIGSDDFNQNLQAIIDSVEGARETGADRPTEGTMKQLIAVLEQEIAKRLTT